MNIPRQTIYALETIGDKPSLRFLVNVAHAKTLFPRETPEPPVQAAPAGSTWVPATLNRTAGLYDQYNQPHLNIHEAAAKNEKYAGGRFVRDDKSEMLVIYGHEKNLPPLDLFHGETPVSSGSLIVGDKGVLYSPNDYGASWKLLPEKEFAGFVGPAPTLARNGRGDQGQKDEWGAAIRGGPKAFSNFDYASLLTETILLGNVAIRARVPLVWDGPRFRFTTGAKEATPFLRRQYRKGWKA